MTSTRPIPRTPPMPNASGYVKTRAVKRCAQSPKVVSAETKPRNKELTAKEKERNRQISRVRVRVEHAIAGVKRSRTVKDVLRNTKDGFRIWSWELHVVCITFESIAERSRWNYAPIIIPELSLMLKSFLISIRLRTKRIFQCHVVRAATWIGRRKVSLHNGTRIVPIISV
jgi:DDE superfamily endonuclease